MKKTAANTWTLDTNTYATTTQIPTVTDTYSASGTDAVSGTAVASAISQISIPTVNDAKFAVKGAGTEVSSTTANASTASSVDIVAGSNVTVTPDATNHTITIAASGGTTSVASTSAAGLAPATTAAVKYLQTNASGTPVWGGLPTDQDTNYYLTVNGTVNGDSGTTDLGTIYAPTTAGTSGQYLASNGSGAPSWTAFNSETWSFTLSDDSIVTKTVLLAQ